MSFDIRECAIPETWCGDKPIPKRDPNSLTYYYRDGTKHECLQKGIGVGKNMSKNLPANSLQQIKYVGDKYESNFKANGILDLGRLFIHVRDLSPPQKEKFFKDIFTMKNGKLDKRAYNSTLAYLYNHGTFDLPKCRKITS